MQRSPQPCPDPQDQVRTYPDPRPAPPDSAGPTTAGSILGSGQLAIKPNTIYIPFGADSSKFHIPPDRPCRKQDV